MLYICEHETSPSKIPRCSGRIQKVHPQRQRRQPFHRVIIGSAFNNIVTAFTKGIVVPVLAIFGGSNLGTSNWKFQIWKKMTKVTEKVNGTEVTTEKRVPVLLDVGAIVGSVIGFLITTAIVFFIIIKPTNKLLDLVINKETPQPPCPPMSPFLPRSPT
jgi:large conductance mechanosensitive channel